MGMGFHVYPLYPSVKRWLRVGVVVYLLLTCFFAYGLYEAPRFSLSAIICSFCALCMLWGLVLCVHLYVWGTTPPEGMTPVARESSPGGSNYRRRTTRYGQVKLNGLSGDEAQPINIAIPGLVMMVVL